MRIVITIIILILLAAGGYTAYGVLTFEPQRPAPLVFREPDEQMLKDLGIYAKQVVVDAGPDLTSTQQAQTNEAIEKIGEALGVYQTFQARAKEPLTSTLQILNNSIASGKLPAFFLNSTNATTPQRSFEMLNYNVEDKVEAQENKISISCLNKASVPTSVLIGDNGSNQIACDSPDATVDQIFLGGPGDDVIVDTEGNRIINGGSGNDNITVGSGRTIIVLEDGWGDDKLKVDCKGSAVAKTEIPQGFPIPWVSPYVNFIVLSPRIQADNVRWEGNTLINTISGDKLSVNEKCFTVIGVREASAAPALPELDANSAPALPSLTSGTQ